MKRFFSLVLFTLLILMISSCGSKTNKKSSVDETTDELIVYIWASNTTVFYETDEIESIKSCYKDSYPEVHTIYHIIQNVDKEEFGSIVNEANDADIILAGNNMDSSDGCNISLRTSNTTSKALVDSSWCNMDERYVGIASICESVHLQNAINFRTMMINKMPDFYKEQNVFFIGNSYTYYNHLSLMFKGICESVGMTVNVDSITSSGKNFEYMLNESTTEHIEMVYKLSQTDFDYVFIQEQSIRPITAYSTFRTTAEELVDLIHSYCPNAKVILYETWARENGNSFYTENPSYTYKSMQKELCDAYTNVGTDLGLKVSYAGVGFYISHESNNGIQLYQSDLTHPSPAGTYLAALIHASTIYGFNPNKVDYVPSFTITQGGSYKTMPTKAECEALRQIAYNVVFNLDLSILED